MDEVRVRVYDWTRSVGELGRTFRHPEVGEHVGGIRSQLRTSTVSDRLERLDGEGAAGQPPGRHDPPSTSAEGRKTPLLVTTPWCRADDGSRDRQPCSSGSNGPRAGRGDGGIAGRLGRRASQV